MSRVGLLGSSRVAQAKLVRSCRFAGRALYFPLNVEQVKLVYDAIPLGPKSHDMGLAYHTILRVILRVVKMNAPLEVA